MLSCYGGLLYCYGVSYHNLLEDFPKYYFKFITGACEPNIIGSQVIPYNSLHYGMLAMHGYS